ncbi:MAG: site-2 protease family protein [Candidatus Hydrogenedentes bacterium]|nr:site-2 protease family protein [Candidatus Hydrogenedentota bacterium]
MLFSIIVFIAVLSLLVFVHELGHFISGKLCNIYIDQFSIGMPPRLFGVRIGETDYCIGALPIGGYVKMAGQEDIPLDDAEREREYGHVPPERWFRNRPLWQRYIVVISGPLMNFVLAIFIYTILVSKGTYLPEMELEARVGKIEENSPAQKAYVYQYIEGVTQKNKYSSTQNLTGWKTGDRIITINGRKIEKFSDIFLGAAIGGTEKEHTVILERTNPDGTTQKLISFLRPEIIGDSEVPRYGITPFYSALIEEVLPGMPAEKAGLQKGDIILCANNTVVDRVTFVELTEKTPPDKPMQLIVMRNNERIYIELTPTSVGRLKGLSLKEVTLSKGSKGLQIADISEEIQTKTGLRRKDIITKINGKEFSIEDLRAYEINHPGETLELEVYRPPVLLGLLESSSYLVAKISLEKVNAIGVTLGERLIKVDYPPSQWIPEALKRSYADLKQTILILRGLIVGSVSPKVLGGPIMIFDATSKAASMGITWLLNLIALISVNLAVVNLLPIPVLDGSLVLLLTIEGIRRKPLSPKLQERFQQIGIAIILMLLVLVSWNDIRRILTDILP